jgi:hypothetical protein
MGDINNKSYEDRIKDIKDNLYAGGGAGQESILLDVMMSPFGSKEFGYADIDPTNVLVSIGNQLKQLIRTVKDGGVIPIKLFEGVKMGKDHHPYACLDNDLKFCVKHYGEDTWKDILYVFPYMNCTTAFDITFKYDNIHTSDI